MTNSKVRWMAVQNIASSSWRMKKNLIQFQYSICMLTFDIFICSTRQRFCPQKKTNANCEKRMKSNGFLFLSFSELHRTLTSKWLKRSTNSKWMGNQNKKRKRKKHSTIYLQQQQQQNLDCKIFNSIRQTIFPFISILLQFYYVFSFIHSNIRISVVFRCSMQVVAVHIQHSK